MRPPVKRHTHEMNRQQAAGGTYPLENQLSFGFPPADNGIAVPGSFRGGIPMKRHGSIAALVLFLVLVSGLPAGAQDATKPDPKTTRKPATARQPRGATSLDAADVPELKIAPVVGEKVEIQVRPGVVMKGVVKDHRYEVLSPFGGYVPVESDEVPFAGIRVYHAMGLDGFIFLRYDSIHKITFHGKLSQEEGLALARRIHEEMKRAAEEKERAIADMAARRQRLADEKAARAVEADQAAAEEEVLGESRRAEDIKKLLERFPPPEWRPARLAELKKRRLILDILPNDEETAFIDNYELWFEGYEIWRKAQEELGKSVAPPEKK